MMKVDPKVKEIYKGGRLKGMSYTKISINVPDEYFEFASIAADINYKGNKSYYIIDLIKKDLEVNREVYEQVKAMKQAAIERTK